MLEANTIGWGASSRNGGMVLTGMKLDVGTLSKRYGMELTRRMYADSLASIDLVEQIVREENIACDFSRCGHLEVACKQSHFDSYARSAEVDRQGVQSSSCGLSRAASCPPRSAPAFTLAAWWMRPARE